MVESGKTLGIWVGDGDSTDITAFDQYFERHGIPEERGRETYSRSARIKEAMLIYRLVHDTLRQDEELSHPDSLALPELQALIRSELAFEKPA